jgi:hypothetical protein
VTAGVREAVTTDAAIPPAAAGDRNDGQIDKEKPPQAIPAAVIEKDFSGLGNRTFRSP